jgi:RHS repeat-associated protein
VSQRFTGQTRDSETGMDFFNARYFGSALGRFTSPDPDPGSMDLTNPQSFNRYYVWNNSLANTDPTGADTCPDGSYADICAVDIPPSDVPTDPCFYSIVTVAAVEGKAVSVYPITGETALGA